MKKIFVPFIVLITVFSTVFIILYDDIYTDVGIQTLYPVPQEISAELQNNEDIYIIHFFASWCDMCSKDLKYIEMIKNRLNIPIYGILINDTPQHLSKKIGSYTTLFTKLYFSFPVNKLINLDIDRIPRIMIIYKNNIVYDHAGSINERIVRRKIIPLLERSANALNKEEISNE